VVFGLSGGDTLVSSSDEDSDASVPSNEEHKVDTQGPNRQRTISGAFLKHTKVDSLILF